MIENIDLRKIRWLEKDKEGDQLVKLLAKNQNLMIKKILKQEKQITKLKERLRKN